MAKMQWDKFVEAHPKHFAFACRVSASLPKAAIKFDANKKKLPTPYGLFLEWMGQNAIAAWTATPESGGFYLLVCSEDDAKRLVKEFSALGPAAKTPISNKTIPLGYRDSNYPALAASLGYALPPKKSSIASPGRSAR